MARYTDSVCKLCRREGTKLFLKGERCLGEKCAVDKRPYPPGQRKRRPGKQTEYSVQLREKQKARRYYGVLERQFRNYYKKASGQKGITGENLLRLLETRLDNVVFRLGLAFSRAEARQMVGHGHFSVNGRRVDIPSYQVRIGDTVGLTEKGKKVARVTEALESSIRPEMPDWLELNKDEPEAKVLRLPDRESIDLPVQEQMIVELYSK